MSQLAPRPPWSGLIAVAGAASLWGLWALCLRPTGLPASVTSPMALAFIGVCALPAAWREPPAQWDRSTVLLLAGNTVCDAINLACFFAALGRTSVAIAVLTHYLAPILIALAAPYIDRTRTRGAPAAAVLATAGLALVLEPWHGGGAGMWAGAALGAISAVAYAGNVFIVRRLAPRIGAGRTMAYHSLIAAALLAPGAIGGLGAVEASDVARIAAGSLVLGAVAGVVYVRGLVKIGAARAAVLTFAEPLVAVLVGWVAFGESLSAWAALGGALVLGAGVAVARAPEYSGPA